MLVNVYSIRDKETGFMSPMLNTSDGSAKREFAMAVNDGNKTIQFSPSDFDLYRIGQYDTETAQLIPVSPVVFVVNGASLVGVSNA